MPGLGIGGATGGGVVQQVPMDDVWQSPKQHWPGQWGTPPGGGHAPPGLPPVPTMPPGIHAHTPTSTAIAGASGASTATGQPPLPPSLTGGGATAGASGSGATSMLPPIHTGPPMPPTPPGSVPPAGGGHAGGAEIKAIADQISALMPRLLQLLSQATAAATTSTPPHGGPAGDAAKGAGGCGMAHGSAGCGTPGQVPTQTPPTPGQTPPGPLKGGDSTQSPPPPPAGTSGGGSVDAISGNGTDKAAEKSGEQKASEKSAEQKSTTQQPQQNPTQKPKKKASKKKKKVVQQAPAGGGVKAGFFKAKDGKWYFRNAHGNVARAAKVPTNKVVIQAPKGFNPAQIRK